MTYSSLVLESDKRCIFFEFNSNEIEIENIIKPLYNLLKREYNKQGDAIIHLIDVLENIIATNFPDYNKINYIPASSIYTIIVKCATGRIYCYRNNPNNTENIYSLNRYYPDKILLTSKIT